MHKSQTEEQWQRFEDKAMACLNSWRRVEEAFTRLHGRSALLSRTTSALQGLRGEFERALGTSWCV